jgi:hypothetical protein
VVDLTGSLANPLNPFQPKYPQVFGDLWTVGVVASASFTKDVSWRSHLLGPSGYVEVVFHYPLVRVVLHVVLHGPRDERLPRRVNRSLKLCLHVPIKASSDCCPHCFVKTHSPSGRRHQPRHQIAQPYLTMASILRVCARAC